MKLQSRFRPARHFSRFPTSLQNDHLKYFNLAFIKSYACLYEVYFYMINRYLPAAAKTARYFVEIRSAARRKICSNQWAHNN